VARPGGGAVRRWRGPAGRPPRSGSALARLGVNGHTK